MAACAGRKVDRGVQTISLEQADSRSHGARYKRVGQYLCTAVERIVDVNVFDEEPAPLIHS